MSPHDAKSIGPVKKVKLSRYYGERDRPSFHTCAMKLQLRHQHDHAILVSPSTSTISYFTLT
jgi:hypothetical protein